MFVPIFVCADPMCVPLIPHSESEPRVVVCG